MHALRLAFLEKELVRCLPPKWTQVNISSRILFSTQTQGRNLRTLSDRRDVNNKANSPGQEKGRWKKTNQHCKYTFSSFCSTFTYHDNSSRLLCCAHTHDWCHSNSCTLEIYPTKRENTVVTLSSTYYMSSHWYKRYPREFLSPLDAESPVTVAQHFE